MTDCKCRHSEQDPLLLREVPIAETEVHLLLPGGQTSAIAYDEGRGCVVRSDDVVEFGGWPGPRGGYGRSPQLPWWRCWSAWWSPAPGRTGPLLRRGRGRRRPPHGRLAARTYQREGLRPRGPRSRSPADRSPTCRRSAWPSNTPVPT